MPPVSSTPQRSPRCVGVSARRSYPAELGVGVTHGASRWAQTVVARCACETQLLATVYLCFLSIFEDSRGFARYLPQLLHARGLRHQDVQHACSLLSQGKWRELWGLALDRAAAQRAKTEANPAVERQRPAKEKEAYAIKCATSGNVSKA